MVTWWKSFGLCNSNAYARHSPCSICNTDFILNHSSPLWGPTSAVCADWPLRVWAQLETPPSAARRSPRPSQSDEEGDGQTVRECELWGKCQTHRSSKSWLITDSHRHLLLTCSLTTEMKMHQKCYFCTVLLSHTTTTKRQWDRFTLFLAVTFNRNRLWKF